jgi:alpha-D-xyloside xylohydrolase
MKNQQCGASLCFIESKITSLKWHWQPMKFILSLIIILFPSFCPGQAIRGYERLSDRVNVDLPEGTLSICPLTDNAVRIKFLKDVDVRVPELIFTPGVRTPAFTISDSPSQLEVRLNKMVVALDKQERNLSFEDSSGRVFLSEKAGTRGLSPDSVMGEPCFVAEQSFESPADEYLFGLGQFQDGHYNVRNISRKLTQVNSQISIPFIYSNKGYGLLWHQYGLTDFNPADNFIALEKQDQSATGNSQAVEVTTTSGTQKVSQHQSLYIGHFAVPSDGVYSIFIDLGDMGSRQYVVIDGKPCIDITNFWLPPTANALVDLKAGEHQLQLVCKSSNSPKVSWKLTDNSGTFRSPNAKLLDYVVFYGPSADSVIATYRNLSGNVPMLPRWAYGFWQCRERYTSGKNLVETVGEFRKRNIPMDVIVQDWQYWGNNGWGVPQFDTANYSNPAGFISKLHSLDAHFNISIWSNPDKNSAIGKEYVSNHLYVPDSKWLDYFNPVTRETYWNTLNENLFTYGVDSWWMDATEPENDALHGKETYFGPGDFYRLTYPLFVSRAVYEGQREATSDKRVCILTRSAFLGQQRYGTINWSGDIAGTWESYKRQIVAGLDYTMTGMPYWTTDIGGFFRPGKLQYTDEGYQELLIRWYQWGAFNPIFRIHGYQSETEPWHFSQQVQDNMKAMLDLRYRLLPYIYSDAWQVTKYGSTMMRPLVMDFKDDSLSLQQEYEYMFGKAILVSPITEPGVSVWNVYLPKDEVWYDFWTGKHLDGGQTTDVAAPLDRIPLMVKAGSIIPMGPFIQYSTEKSDPVEIRIYPGANGEFTLYEDENDGYDYEKGRYSTIELKWNDSVHTLTIGKRQGDFPGMTKNRTFRVVVVSLDHGTGADTTTNADKVVKYDGRETGIVLH